jgi:hypothetical protein
MQHLQLTGGTGKDGRRELDFYPTPADVTKALLKFLGWPAGWHIHDPACGDGAMCRVFESMGYQASGADIRTDTGYGRQGVDFLKTWPVGPAFDAIVTNPPFAQSEEFIRHALKCTPWVAMVVKSQYWHAAKRYQLFMDHPPTWVLPLTWRPDFMNKGKGAAPTLEVQWTVWTPGSKLTTFKPLLRP